jgi:hypothetical protein
MQVIISTRGMTVSRVYQEALARPARRRVFRSRQTDSGLEAAVDRAVRARRRQVRELEARRPRRVPVRS